MNKAFDISRRRLLLSLPALVMAPREFVQTANPLIRARGINHVTLDVSDVKRSVDFYQGLFGMPVINRQGTTSAGLQIGNGTQHLGLYSASSNAPKINQLCLDVDNLNVDWLKVFLSEHDITESVPISFTRSCLAFGSRRIKDGETRCSVSAMPANFWRSVLVAAKERRARPGPAPSFTFA